jgi:hypothetical protein
VNVGKNKFRNMKRSANGHNVIDIATQIKKVMSEAQARLLELLYHEIFKLAASSEGNTNESLQHK